MSPTKDGVLGLALLGLALGGLPGSAHAASDPYPSEPVVIVVPASPGGALDLTTRLLAPKIEEVLGQTVIVENRVGGESIIGTRKVGDANPDGYTILAHANTFIATPQFKQDPPYDPIDGFRGLGIALLSGQVIYTGADQPDADATELVARAGTNPGVVTYAHGGSGSPMQMSALQFSQEQHLDMREVPYKGTGPAMPDVATGRVDIIMAGYAGGQPFLESGAMRALGVTSDERMPALPDVPTLKEQGIDFSYYYWLGFFAPAGTPDDVVEKLNAAIRQATPARRSSSA